MCRREMHGDPEAMRSFAARLAGLDTEVDPPEPTPCLEGMEACGTFAAADAVATLALAQFLAETGEAVAALRSAANEAAEDYEATDRAGALTIAVVAVED
ncbi:hypothetical protein GCM10027445_64700 [Amycolatopsis endophytica]